MSQSTASQTAPGDGPKRRRRFGCRTWTLILLGFALLFSALPIGPQHAAIRTALERLIVARTDREVFIGTVTGVLWGGVRVERIMVANEGGFGPARDNVAASLDGVRLRYSLLRLLLHPSDPLAAVKRLDIANPQLLVRRDAKGRWELAALLPRPREGERRRPFSFRGTITVGRGKLVLLDASKGAPGKPLRLDISHDRTILRFERGGRASFETALEKILESPTPDGPAPLGIERIEVTGRLTLEPLTIETDIALRQARLDILGNYLNSSLEPHVRLLGGRADVTGPVAWRTGADGKGELDLALRIDATEAAVGVGALARPIERITGGLTVAQGPSAEKAHRGRNGLLFDHLALAVGESRVTLDGRLSRYSDLDLDLQVRSDSLRPADLRAALPKLLPNLAGEGPTALDLRLRGGREDLRVEGSVRPAEVRWADVAVRGGRVRLDLLRVPAGRGVGSVTGLVRFDGVDIASPRLGRPLFALRGGLQLLDNGLAFDSLSGRFGAAPVRLSGRVQGLTKGREAVLALETGIEGLEPAAVAPLLPATLRPRAARGTITARLRLNGPLRALGVAGEVRLPWLELPLATHLGGRYACDLKLGPQPTGWLRFADAGLDARRLGAPLTELAGGVSFGAGEVRIDSFRGRYGGDPVRVAGRVALDGSRFDLALATPGLDAARAVRALGRRDVAASGRLRADLRVAGTRSRVRVRGTAVLPVVTLPQLAIRGAAVRADLTIDPRRGAAGLHGALTLRDADLRSAALGAPVTIAAADLRFDGSELRVREATGRLNGDPVAVRGRITGLPGVRALDLRVHAERLRDATRALLARRLESLARVRFALPAGGEVSLRGPLETLHIAGKVHLPAVLLEAERPTQLGGRFELDLTLGQSPADYRGTVRWIDGRVLPGGTDLTLADIAGTLRFASGRVRTEPELTARFGESRVQAAGSVGLGKETDLDLLLTAPTLRLDDLRPALATMDQAPELTGEGDLSAAGLRLFGPLSHLRITTLGSGAEPGGRIGLPRRLVVRLPAERGGGEYELAGGTLGADLLLTEGRIASGRLLLDEAGVSVGPTGTRAAVAHAELAVRDGVLAEAEVQAAIGGGSVTAIASSTDNALTARVQTTGVPLYALLPRLESLEPTLGYRSPPLVAADLSVAGPPDDLVVGGRVAVGDSATAPLAADAHLRLVRTADGARQLLGGAVLAGGDLPLAALAEPLGDLRGGLSFGPADVTLHDVQASLGGAPITFRGAIYGLPEAVFDLAVDLTGVDAGRVLTALRVPTDDPGAERVDLSTRYGWPQLLTPQPIAGGLRLIGPRDHVSVTIDVSLPQVTLASAEAIPDDRGLGSRDLGAGTLLCGDVRLQGTAVGSLSTGALPSPAEAVAAIEVLAGVRHAVDETPAPAAASAPSWLERFHLDLRLDVGALDPRQLAAFAPEETRTQGLLPTLYAYQPGRLRARMFGPAADPQISGRAELARIELHGVPLRRAETSFVYHDRVATFTEALAEIRGGLVRGEGAARLEPGRPVDLQVQAVIEGIELAAAGLADPDHLGRLGLDGLIDGTAQIHLADEVPRAVGYATVRGFELSGERLGDAELDFAFEDKRLVLRRLALEDPLTRTHARARGEVTLAGDGPIDLLVDVRNFDLARLTAPAAGEGGAAAEFPAVTGRLDFVGAVGGNRTCPLVTGVGNVFFGSLGGWPFNRLSIASRQVGPDRLALSAEISDPAYRARAEGTLAGIDLERGEATYSLDIDLAAVDLAQAMPLFDHPALARSSGRLSGRATVRGRVEREVVVDAEGRETTRLTPLANLGGEVTLSAGQDGEPGSLVAGGVVLDSAAFHLLIADDQVMVDDLAVRRGKTRIGIDPRRANRIWDLRGDRNVELHIVSDEFHYEDILSLTGLPLRTKGYLTGAVDVEGTLSEYLATVTLATHGLELNDEKIGDRRLTARVAPGVAEIEGSEAFELFGTRLSIAGGATKENVDLGLRAEVFDPEKLRGLLVDLTATVPGRPPRAWQMTLARVLKQVPAPLDGEVTLAARLHGRRRQPTGYVDLALRGVRSRGEPAKVVPDAVVSVNLGTTTARRPERFEPGLVYCVGSADLGGDAGAALRLDLRGEGIDLAPLAGWLPPNVGLQGRLSFSATATGSTRDPRLDLVRLTVDGVGTRSVSFARLTAQDLVYTRDWLDLGDIRLVDGSLHASLGGRLPVGGAEPREGWPLTRWFRRGEPIQLHFEADIGRFAEFADAMGSVGAIDGSGAVSLTLSGSAESPVIDGALQAAAPAVDIVKSRAQPAVHAAQLGPAPAAATSSVEVTPVARLADVEVDLRVERNALEFRRCYARVLPPEDGAAQSSGELEVLPGGRVDLGRLRFDRLFENRMDLRLAARGVAVDVGVLHARDLDLELAVEPVTGGRGLTRIRVERGQGWINGGFVALAGGVTLTHPEPRYWTEHDYDLVLSTPPVRPDGTPAPDGTVCPVGLDLPGVVSTKARGALRLETQARRAPPTALTGSIDLFDTVVREGALALFARRPDRPAARWPAAPTVDIAIVATENNWIRARVPQVTVPFSATVRLTETPQRLQAAGTMRLGDGDVSSTVLVNPIRLTGGRLDATLRRNPLSGAFEPFINFQGAATTFIVQAAGGGDHRRYDIDLDVRGTAWPGKEKPVDTDVVVKAESRPALPEEEIFALLSRRQEFAQALEAGTLQGLLRQELANVALQTAWAYTLSPLLDEFRRAVGLDVLTLRVELDRPLEVEVGKYLVKNLFLTMIMEVGQKTGTKQTFRVDYELPGGFRVGGQVDTEQEFRVTTEYSREF